MIFLTKNIAHIINFFTKGHQRTINAKKNIAASFAIKGVSIVISLAFVPMTINYVNPTQYGIWLTLSSIVAWFSFFDIGFSNGLRNKFAQAKADGNLEDARIYLSTTYAVLFLLFSVVWILFFVLNFFLDWSQILNAPSDMAIQLSKLALIVFSFFCIQIVLKTINTVLIADQKPAKAAFFDMLGLLIALLIIFILTKTTSGSLLYLGLAIGGSTLLTLLASSFWFYKNHYRYFSPSFKFVRFSHAKDILKLGVKFFIIQIAVLVIYQTSNIIIAQVCSPEDVTIYNIAFKYFGIGTMVFGIVMTPFWSAFTDAYAKGDYTWMKTTVKKLRIIAFILIIVVSMMILISNKVYRLWIGDIVSIRITVSIMVAIYVMTNIWNTLNSLLLNGMGKIKLQLYVSLTGILLNIPMAIFLGKKFGIEGVVLSSVFLNLISAIYAPIQVSLLLNRKAKGVWNG
jgi:O-antigen/teichoic acid export membrane protein